MQFITIRKQELLPIVKENKKKHDAIYTAAVSGYWVKAEAVLQKKLAQVQKKEQIDNYLVLTYPVNYSDDYDRAARMLELSADNEVKLTESEFDCYVRNQWQWRGTFLATNTAYISGYCGPSGPAGTDGCNDSNYSF